jgi:hypothetical protein
MTDRKKIAPDEVPQTREEVLSRYPFLRAIPELKEQVIERAMPLLASEERFLAAIGAFSEGHGTFSDFLTRIHAEWIRLPGAVDFDHMAEITSRFLGRIERGEMIIPAQVKETFKEFYAK